MDNYLLLYMKIKIKNTFKQNTKTNFDYIDKV